MKQNYDKQQVNALDEISTIMLINTIATIITGVATLILAILQLLK